MLLFYMEPKFREVGLFHFLLLLTQDFVRQPLLERGLSLAFETEDIEIMVLQHRFRRLQLIDLTPIT